MFDIIIIFLVGIFLLFAVYTAIQFLGKFPQRTVDDVAPYLRPAESGELEALLDPGQEANFRMRMSPQEFAPWQRRRIHLAPDVGRHNKDSRADHRTHDQHGGAGQAQSPYQFLILMTVNIPVAALIRLRGCRCAQEASESSLVVSRWLLAFGRQLHACHPEEGYFARRRTYAVRWFQQNA